MIELVVYGEAKGKGRPRFVRATGRTYTPAATKTAEQRIQGEWIAAGRPRLDDVPLAMKLEVVVERPKGHWKTDGTLSAAGQRSSWPTRKPDLDNAVKLVMDALNGQAYKDDVLICSTALWKRWANPGERAHTRIEIWTLPAAHSVLKAAA